VGVAQIFAAVPGMKHLLAYWYHFIVMFEAVFILTTVDAGTRVARFLAQEAIGRVSPSLGSTTSIPGNLIATTLVVLSWGAFLKTGSIQTLWPMLGIANQLLATTALCVGTAVIVSSGKARYAWVTAVPMAFVGTTTLTAAYLSIVDNFLKLGTVAGYVDAGLSALLMVSAIVIIAQTGWRIASRRSAPAVAAAEG
jgi:carbon starvation protein